MPTQEVSIIVRGSQLDEEGRETITELNIQGQYFVQNGSRYLLYEEPGDGRQHTHHAEDKRSCHGTDQKRSRMLPHAL